MIGGVVLAALLGQLDLVGRWSGTRIRGGFPSVLGAACLGGISPLPTHSTTPVLLQLVENGASPAPAVAFLTASSMLNPQLFLLILGGLGPRLALTQIAGVLLLSSIAGWAASRLPPSLLLRPLVLSASSLDAPTHRFSWRSLGRDMVGLAGWVGFTFVIGVILAALLQVLVPAQWVASRLGEGHLLTVVLASLLGIPLYTCGGSAVPVLAGLLDTGMSPSAVLAFLLSGPATRMTALAAIGSLLNRRALVLYILYVVTGAVILGVLLG